MLQPSDCVYSESLTPNGKLVACRRDLNEVLVFMNLFLIAFMTLSKNVYFRLRNDKKSMMFLPIAIYCFVIRRIIASGS